MGVDPVLNVTFFFGLISTGVPYLERGYQAGLRTAAHVVSGQVMVPPGLFAIYAVALVNS
jgi:hypothetical protein